MPKGVLWRQADIFLGRDGRSPARHVDECPSSTRSPTAARRRRRCACMPAPPFMHGAAHWAGVHRMTGGGTLVVQDDAAPARPGRRAGSTVEREQVQHPPDRRRRLRPPLIDELERGELRHAARCACSSAAARRSTRRSSTRSSTAARTLIVFDARRLVGDRRAGGPISSKGGVQHGHVHARTRHVRRQRGPADACSSRATRRSAGWPSRAACRSATWATRPRPRRTFPVIDGVRYSVPGDRARCSPTAASSCSAATR